MVIQPQPVPESLNDTSSLVIRGFQFTDNNKNDLLEAYETSHIQFRLYNLGDEDAENIYVHIEQLDENRSAISFPKSISLGNYPSYYMKDISIPIKGSKNLSDGLAIIRVFISEAGGFESKPQTIEIRTRKYQPPDLKIINADFTSQGGKEIKLNQPIKLNIAIKNVGQGTAYKVESLLRLIYDNVQFVATKPEIKIDELQSGKTLELNYQILANKNYFLPELPVILELSEDISKFHLDTMFMTPIISPEEKKEIVAQPVPDKTKEAAIPETKEPEITLATVALPDLELFNLEFFDDNDNNVIDHEESCEIKFKVRNSGTGQAKDVSVHINQMNTGIEGLKFPETIKLGILDPETEKDVTIPITSQGPLPSDLAEFRIEVLESRGLDAYPLVFEIKTEKLQEPDLAIEFSDFIDESGQLRRNYPIELLVSVKNIGPGRASGVKVQFELPDENCVLLGEKKMFDLDLLNSGETRNFSMLFTATRRYTANKIPVKVKVTESQSKYGIDTILVGDLNREVQAQITHKIEPRVSEQKIEEPAVDVQKIEEPANEVRGGGDPLKGLAFEEAINEMKIGRYFALIIGIDDYMGKWPPLKNAVRDAQSVEEILKSKYKFDHFRSLYNDMATRENIIREFEWLVRNVTPEDNILIFFSGHGEYKQEMNRGYWIPVEAKTASTYDYISNSVIQDFLSSIDSKHTLLISDACFSGDIFRGNTISIPFEKSERYYRTVHTKASRQAITSGGLEPVMDGGRDGHSVFSYYLLKSLETNPNTFFDASQLYNDLKIPVVNNSNQSPEFKHLKNTGDEGGQFIFIRK